MRKKNIVYEDNIHLIKNILLSYFIATDLVCLKKMSDTQAAIESCFNVKITF